MESCTSAPSQPVGGNGGFETTGSVGSGILIRFREILAD